MRIRLFLTRKLPTVIGLACMGGVALSRQSWAWRSKATTIVHTPACKSSIISNRWRASAMDDATSSSSSEIQTADNQLHPLCKPFPVPTAAEAVDEVNFDWRSIASSVFNSGDSRPVVLFDGVCNLCNGAVNFSLDHDAKGTFGSFFPLSLHLPYLSLYISYFENIPPFLYYYVF